MPDNAKGNSPEAAAHFVEYYIELLNYASATGDVEPLESRSANSCKGCSNYIKLYRETYENGGYFKDSVWTPRAPVPYKQGSKCTVLVSIHATDGAYVLRKGKPEQKGRGGIYALRFELHYRDGDWKVSVFERQAET